jgi:hypothetical protein
MTLFVVALSAFVVAKVGLSAFYTALPVWLAEPSKFVGLHRQAQQCELLANFRVVLLLFRPFLSETRSLTGCLWAVRRG